MHLMHTFYIFATALFSSLIMVPAIRRWAIDTGAIDFPGERRAHNRAVARAGGVAIFVPFMFSVLVYFDITREVRGVLAGSLLIFFTGLVDDLYQLSARQKFIGQISGCLVAILVGRLYLTELGDLFGFGQIVLPIWAGGILSLFALVGIVNALNLIDGLDGLAGGLSAIAVLAFIWLALQERNMAVLAVSVALLGSLLGFLKYNAFPARIFMGDTGSLVVGFLLGALSIMLTQGKGTVKAVVPLMILSVPIVDTLVVMIRRLLKGAAVLKADRTHIHHKIVDLGLDQSLTVLLIHSLALVCAIAALLFRRQPEYVLFGVVVAGSFATHFMINVLLRRRCVLSGIEEKIGRSVSSGDRSRLKQFVEQGSSYLIVSLLFFYGFLGVMGAAGVESVMLAVFSLSVGLLGLLVLVVFPQRINLFCLLILTTILFISYQVEAASDFLILGGLSVAWISNAVFVLLAILVVFKFILMKSTDTVLDLLFEFILFAMALTLAVVSADLDLEYHVSGVVSKGIVSFIALKLLIIGSRKQALSVAVAMTLSLLLIVSSVLT